MTPKINVRIVEVIYAIIYYPMFIQVLTTELNPDYMDKEELGMIDTTKEEEIEGVDEKRVNEESLETNVDSPITETITPSQNKETELRQRKTPSARLVLQLNILMWLIMHTH